MKRISDGPWDTSDEALLDEFYRCLQALIETEDTVETLEKRIETMQRQHHQFIHDYGLFDD